MAEKLRLSSRLRQLKPSDIHHLKVMLDPLDKWKEMAANILNRRGKPMFDVDSITLISVMTQKSGRSATEEIINNWSTDNPTVKDLRAVLKKINAERAVHFIDNNILEGCSDIVPSDNSYDAHEDRTSDGGELLNRCEKFSYDCLRKITLHFSPDCLIGEGNFGEVFKGFHEYYPVLAVKRFKDSDQLDCKQFITELQILSRCKHENILPLVGYSNDDHLCLVYLYMINGSLEDRLACKDNTPSLEVGVRLNVVKGVARGLHYLHSLKPPLIHRDIKSANILLDDKFTAKVGDCGTVRDGPHGSKTCTHTQMAIGTIPYMPVEYSVENEVSVKTDAYSLGVILLEILTGLPVMDDDREDKALPTHVQESLEDDNDISNMLDISAGEWGETLPSDMFKMSKQFMEHKRRRWTVTQALPEIESWEAPNT